MADASPLRVLIVRIGSMGDVLHAMPAVFGLRAAVPGCVIGWAVERRWTALLEAEDGNRPLVDRVHRLSTNDWRARPFSRQTAREIWALRCELRHERYDVAVDLQGSIKSAVTGWMAGAKRLVGPLKPREREAGYFYNQRIDLSKTNVIGQACEALGVAVGLRVPPISQGESGFDFMGYTREEGLTAQRVVLPFDPAAERWCDHIFAEDNRPAVLLVPTAGWGAKEWGASRFVELSKALRAAGCRVLVNALPDARSEVAYASGGEAVPSTLPQMVALVRRVALVIGGDTGPVHLAAALGRPVIALFGPTDPARNGPAFPGARVTILRDLSSVTSHKRLPTTDPGLARITVGEVLAAALDALQRGNE